MTRQHGTHNLRFLNFEFGVDDIDNVYTMRKQA